MEHLSCKCEEFIEANHPIHSHLPTAHSMFPHSDGCTSEKPIRIREPTLSFSSPPPTPLHLIPSSYLSLLDVSWWREIDKRLSAIPRLWKSQNLLAVRLPLCGTRSHSLPHSWNGSWTKRHAFNFKMSSPRQAFLVWSAPLCFARAELTRCVCVWMDAKHRHDFASRQR